MSNKEILIILKTTASLLELYGENQFKVRSYQTAVYNLERTNHDLSQLNIKDLSKLSGVGKSIASTIEEINQTGASSTLENLLKQTPSGILELLKIKGLAARKIKVTWDELGIESAEALLQAANQGLLADLQGFGSKTQDRIRKILQFHLTTKGLHHFKEAHQSGLAIEQVLMEQFPTTRLERTGEFRRKAEVISSIQYLWGLTNPLAAEEFLDNLELLTKDQAQSGPFRWRGSFNNSILKIDIRFCDPKEFGGKQVYYTGNSQHLKLKNNEGIMLRDLLKSKVEKEEEIYQSFGWPVILPELREGLFEAEFQNSSKQEEVLQLNDIRGILHNHSTYSDGKNSLKEMAVSCKDLGYSYFGITDHSQSAVYANGLDEERIMEQHREIEQINLEMAPFKVFKGIESDILNDGSLDYPESVLKTFDFIVSSIHSNINMEADQATKRLIKAIENPYTTILGHPTGRQLLRREGYPIHHEKIIEACAANGVVIEINAHPMRLDLDWRWVRFAVDKGVLISINPDAHEKSGLEDVSYGVYVARKAGLPTDMTFNAFDLPQMEQYLHERNQKPDLLKAT